MPQGLTVPAWYNDDHYISEKVDECNTIKFGDQSDWNVDSVKAALASAFGEETYAPWMGYDNFVSNGNAENCSPSRYFVVSEYLAAKAAQLNEIQYEDKTDWDQAKVLDAFRAANISAWDHYTTTGQQEGINPSNAFDNDAFFTAKCAILNAWQNEDGTVGYEGKDDWTKDDVIAVFQSLGINPIMNQPENPDAASLVIKAENPVDGGNFNPWAGGAPELEPVELTTGQDILTSDVPTNFIGTVATSQAKSTLNSNDQITGSDGDVLTIDLNASFQGMTRGGFINNVPTVDVNNVTTRNLNFKANGFEGVETFNLDGNITDLSNVEANVAVNLANFTANSATIGYAKNQVDNTDDILALGLRDVAVRGSRGTVSEVAINAAGIETLEVTSTGKKNIVDLSGVSSMKALSVSDDADLDVVKTSAPLAAINASEATGDVTIDATNADQIKSASFGSGDDTLTVNGLLMTAAIDGGDGEDELVLTGVTVRDTTYQLAMNNVETLTVANSTKNLALSGENIDGLETLTVRNAGGDVTFAEYVSASELVVNAEGANAKNITIADMTDITFNVGDKKTDTSDTFSGNIIMPDATTLTVNVLDGTATGPAAFTGNIEAPEVTDLTISTRSAGSSFTASNDNVLGQVENMTVTGFGEVDLTDANDLGKDSDNLSVDANGLYANFLATFTASSNDQSLDVIGSNTGENTFTVNGVYDNIQITTGLGNDVLDLTNATPVTGGNYSFDLGQGTNIVLGSQELWGEYFEGQNVLWAGGANVVDASDIAGKDIVLQPGQSLTVNAKDLDQVDLSGIDGDGEVTATNVKDGATVTTGGGDYTLQGVTGATSMTAGLTQSGSNVTIEAPAGASGFNPTFNPMANDTEGVFKCTSGADEVSVTRPAGAATDGGWMKLIVKNFNSGSSDKIINVNGIGDNGLPGSTNAPVYLSNTYGNGKLNTEEVSKYLTLAGVDFDPSSLQAVREGSSATSNSKSIWAVRFDSDTYGDSTAILIGGDTATAVVLQGVQLGQANTGALGGFYLDPSTVLEGGIW